MSSANNERDTTTPDNGSSRHKTLNVMTMKFSRLIKKVHLQVSKDMGFYTLRRIVTMIATRSGNPFTTQRYLGHVGLQMATRYVKDISAQTYRVIVNGRKYFV